MKVLQTFNHVALLFLGLMLIHGCNDNRMAPTEPLQLLDQVTVAKDTPDGGSRFVFQSWRDGQAEIYVMNADGSGQTNISNWQYYDGAPAWSPNGQKIVFSTWRNGWKFYIMNDDGSDQTLLETGDVTDPWHPAWSPNGKKIVFVGIHDYLGPEENYEIYVVNVDGTGMTRLTDNLAWDGAPEYSPNGKQIAFHSDRGGNFDIYLMNTDGSGLTNLTNYGAGDNTVPVWSPNGKRIAFRSTRDGDEEIYVMNADGSGQTRLTDNPGVDRHPAWSPNGKWIAFDSEREGTPDRQIYIMNADGSGVTNLSNHEYWDGFVDWIQGEGEDDEDDE